LENKLKERLRVTMPVCMDVRNDHVFNTVNRDFEHANFIIHEACIVDGKLTNQIEGLNYCIIFLDKFAREVDNATRIWIDGDTMHTLVTHTFVRVKFVFEQTITHKDGWIERVVFGQQVSQSQQPIAKSSIFARSPILAESIIPKLATVRTTSIAEAAFFA